MFKENPDINDYEYILDNLRQEDLEEVKAVWQDNWRDNVLKSLENTQVLVLEGKDKDNNIVPVAMGGFYEQPEKTANIACVWMLSTDFVKYNKLLLTKALKISVSKAEEKYDLMYNYIFKSNKQAKNWLYKLGFSFSSINSDKNFYNENFEFFYKFVKRKDN